MTSPPAGVIPARQARSRRTVERLLRAADALFVERGIAEVGVAELAARAGVAVGTFYGRFADKEAFLQAWFDASYARGTTQLDAAALRAEAADATPAALVRAYVAARARAYRERRAVLRAVGAYARAHDDPHLHRRRAELGALATRALGELVAPALAAAGRGRGRAPEERALAFAVWLVAATLQDAIVFADRRSPTLRLTDDELVDELTRAVLGYLGLEPPPSTTAPA
jgi:AcrR family transcriptional regulator